MLIYTKTGDDGTTGLFGGKRVYKDDLLLHAYGTLDELNAILGLARTETTNPKLTEILNWLQTVLFAAGADMATPPDDVNASKHIERVTPAFAEQAEKYIDELTAELPELKNFILPGGEKAAAQLHAARAVCRRAERHLAAAMKSHSMNPELLIFVNRISDLLFVLARYANHIAGTADTPWQKNRG